MFLAVGWSKGLRDWAVRSVTVAKWTDIGLRIVESIKWVHTHKDFKQLFGI